MYYERKFHDCHTNTWVDFAEYCVKTVIKTANHSSTFVTEIPYDSFLFSELYDTHFKGVASKCEEISRRHGNCKTDEDDAC